MSTNDARLFARRVLLGSCALLLLLDASSRAAAAQGTAAPEPPATTEPTGVLAEPAIIARAIDITTRMMGDGGDVKNGLYLELSNMPTGSGWISGGPGYRRWLFGDTAIADASTAISWRAYKMAQARFELPHLARSRFIAGLQVRWQDLTQVTYFGEGPMSAESERSEYRLRSTNVVGYAMVRPTAQLTAGYRVGWLTRPELMPPSGSFKRGNPATEHVFADDPVFALVEQPNYGHVDGSLDYDSRNDRSHPTRGGIYRFAWSSYTDRDTGLFSFERSEAEAAHFVPLADARVVLAMRGWLVATYAKEGKLVPFYLAPSLGGHNTLRGYADYRFHDRNLLVFNLETRVALFTHIDAALFADAGNVAPHLADLNVDKVAFGAGLRMHAHRATFARVDVACGQEGWRFMFRISDPLHLARLSRRTAAIPFVP
jgi:hypothetical protein